ncbi:MAG: hypothetical protein A2033_03390 [Bacteroidetes bacterium GWA2_31_9]|nr:MAG: hypothetical protein A2033_03390 [Bacteroidetes bacterium GWA2_31_9]
MVSGTILKLMGWKIEGSFPNIDKAIVIVAPHTSMMDFVLGRLCFNSLGIYVNFLIKQELFFFPLGFILRGLGALPVARDQKNNMVEKVSQLFRSKKRMFLVITPEGTRKKTTNWKRGFYLIAQRAKVPIYLGAVDYKKKVMIIGSEFQITGDANTDMNSIKKFYIGVTAKHPENFSIGKID